MLIFLGLTVVIEFLLIVYLLFYFNVFKFGSKKSLRPRPQNPNSSVQECQFCGVLGAQRSIDGYWVCPSCKVLKLNQVS